MRLFIAFDVPEDQKTRIETLVESWRPRVEARWTRAEGRHVTLVFLGEVDSARAMKVKAAMDEVAARHRHHVLRVASAGTFGAATHPRVLWLGLDGELDAARALQADLQNKLEVKEEHDGWAAHLTLARSKNPRGDAALLDVAGALKRERFDEFTVREIVLYESRGGHYFVVHTAKLT